MKKRRISSLIRSPVSIGGGLIPQMRRCWLIGLLGVGALMAGLFMLLPTSVWADGGNQSTPTPAARQMSNPTSWTQPPPDGPSQAEHGAFVYWMHCMVCHGDQGQGLAKFRPFFPKQDQNCSAHGCHNDPNAGAGFTFPDAPAIMGPGTLTGFKTAQDLYHFVSTRMPYQAPGTLTQSDYWALVAFLLQKHGVSVGQLDEQNAPQVSVNASANSNPINIYIYVALGIAVLILGAAGLGLLARYRRQGRYTG